MSFTLEKSGKGGVKGCKGRKGRSGEIPPEEVFFALQAYKRRKLEPRPSRWRCVGDPEAFGAQSIVQLLNEKDEVLADCWTPLHDGKGRKTRIRIVLSSRGQRPRLQPDDDLSWLPDPQTTDRAAD